MVEERGERSGIPAFFIRLFARLPCAISAAILLLAAPASAEREGALSPLLDASRDVVVRSALVPYALFPQAEVRLIRRNGSVVMQTVIVSRFLKRVVGEIRRKEESAWTPGREGHEDSQRYVDALDRAYRAEEVASRARDAGEDGRRSLLIEFVLSREEAFVAILAPEIRGNFGDLGVTNRRVMEILPLSRRYVSENILEIAIDSLDWTRREAEEALKPLLPGGLQPERERSEQGREPEGS